MSQFYIGSTSQSPSSTPAYDHRSSLDYDSDDEDTLPYPTELPRNDFLAPDFDPQDYLSSLRNRHQTLEDLRSDLRQRSQLLNKELLDLVNGNYEEFLSLGGDLNGGEEKVESVRVGLLGFQREVVGIRRVVSEREAEVRTLLVERKQVRRDVALGRGLLEVDGMIGELEEALGVKSDEGLEDEDAVDDEDAALDTSPATAQLTKLQRHTQQYLLIRRQVERLGPDHPFLQAQKSRINGLGRTLLLDLASALRQAKAAKEAEAILCIVRMHGDLGAEAESVRVLKGG